MPQETAAKYLNLPFKEAISFFRQKINLPTKAWDDLEKDMHAKAFMVAGVMKAELLTDLRKAVDKSIAEGGTPEMFKKEFDSIVGKHGWKHKGNPGWRSNIIIQTNTSMAYSAGRWKGQTSDAVKAVRPYLRYLPSSSLNKNKDHIPYYNLVLPSDDSFWLTHYPPNGWGCHCGVTSLSGRELERLQNEEQEYPINTSSPQLQEKEFVKKSTGEVKTVLEGCDPSFDYNPGIAGQVQGYKSLTKYFETLPNDIARAWATEFTAGPAYEMFVAGEIKGNFPVAVLHESDMEILGSKSQVVWFSDDSLAKNKGDIPTRSAGHADLDLEDYKLIPEIIDTGEIYMQNDERLLILKHGNKTYRASLKRTKDGKENYFLSLFSVGERAVSQVEKKGYERIR